ncbi:universal stress protein [Leifsonia aquatica]|uniref:universal stress protein n=1 Tax=Leifsonia aquatica TaxID=144185 RepID=UPI00384BE451
MTSASAAGPIVVGVRAGQHRVVVQEAAALAAELGRALLCATVAADSYLEEWDPADGRDQGSLHPAGMDSDDRAIALALAGSIGDALGPDAPEWTLRVLAGDPRHALARLATEVDARLIVVGAHPHGFGHAVEGLLSGSVATRLAHDQQRPVVVIPVPGGGAGDLLG